MTVYEIASGHPDSELLAAFAEGKLERREIRRVLEHLDRCASCRVGVELATETAAEDVEAPADVPQSRRRWMAVAAAIVLAVLAVPLVRYLTRSPADDLVRLSPHAARVVEPRLTGGFAWAPYHGPERAGESQKTAEWLKLRGAAGSAIEDAEREASLETQHTAAIARVLVEDEEKAVAQLRAVVARDPGNANAWSDLAAAEYAAAIRGQAPSRFPTALAAADRALRIDPKLPEALFNRALIVTQIGVHEEARAAWRRYLAVDPSSPWATEARKHLLELSPRNGGGFQRDQPALESAAAAGDDARVLALVTAYPEQSRRYAEAEYLGRWGEAVQKGDAAEADRLLAIVRRIGLALARSTGEELVRDSAAAIDGAATPARRMRLAGAHATYRVARRAYSAGRAAEAERGLRTAARDFAAVESPMALVSRSYAAGARFSQNDAATAKAEMTTLLQEVSAYSGYIALGAQIRWELARSHVALDELTPAIELLTSAEQAFTRLGERGNAAFVETMLASLLVLAGNPEEAWQARIRSFATMSVEGPLDRLATGLDGAADRELRAGRPEAALALLNLEEALGRAAADDLLLSQTLIRKSMLYSTMNHDGAQDGALTAAREAQTVAGRIPDGALRERQVADVELATAAAIAGTQPQQAIDLLDRTIDFYRAHSLPRFLPQPLLLRARASLRTGNGERAMRDLDEGMATVEQHKLAAGGAVTNATIDASGEALFEEAIRAHLTRGDVAAALATAERARAAAAGLAAGTGSSLAELQQRLAGTGGMLLELVALDDEVVVFSVTASDVDAARRPVPRGELATLGARVLARDAEAGRRLYDLLIAPSEAAIATARSLVIVPDAWLEDVPFAALQDAQGRYLIEAVPVAIAASSRLIGTSKPMASAPRLAAIALPSDGPLETLPATEREIAEIGAFYRHAETLPASRATFAAFVAAASRADVVHIAGHTLRRKGSGDPALVFDRGERVAWNDIAARFGAHPDVVLLSACETLRRRRMTQTRSLSLGGAFLAAGTSDVIGTVAPINDRDALELFRSIHAQLAAGLGAAEALRQVQRDAIASEKSGGSPVGWRTVALLTNRLPAGGRTP